MSEVNNHYDKYIEEGYIWECGCGEIYKTEEAAWTCRKCLRYLYPKTYANRTVTNLTELEEVK